MTLKIKTLTDGDRARWIIMVAFGITLLLFAYSAISDFDFAIAELLDAVVGCGILGTVLWGWHLLNNKKLPIEVCLAVSSGTIILPLFIYSQEYRIIECVFNILGIFAPVLCHIVAVHAIKSTQKEQRWLGVLSIAFIIILICCIVLIAGMAVIDEPVLAAFWAIEIAAICDKDRHSHLIYAVWLAALWMSGLLCDAGVSFYWASYIRRFLLPMNLFLWPAIFYLFVRSICSCFEKKAPHAPLKAACICLSVFVALWALNLLFIDILVEKYRITHLLYFLLLSDLIIWRELGAGAEQIQDRMGIGFGLLLINIGTLGYYLYQKILLMERAAAATPDGLP